MFTPMQVQISGAVSLPEKNAYICYFHKYDPRDARLNFFLNRDQRQSMRLTILKEIGTYQSQGFLFQGASS